MPSPKKMLIQFSNNPIYMPGGLETKFMFSVASLFLLRNIFYSCLHWSMKSEARQKRQKSLNSIK